MKTLTVDKEKLVDALVALNHAGAIRDTLPYMVAFNPDDEAPKGRVIWADTPSSMGGYFANFVGEENIRPDAFLVDGNDYGWSADADEDDEEGVEIDADLIEMAAKDWIEENLIDTLDSEFGLFTVVYE